MTTVVLASASQSRLRVLRQAGIDPQVTVSHLDEHALVASLDRDAPPESVVAKLANAKALTVAALLPEELISDCVVIGCDSMLYLDGRMHGKPRTAEAARRQWEKMAGATGHLLTGHAILRLTAGVITHTESDTGSTVVQFAQPSPIDLNRYLASDEPLNVAGAFTLDGIGGWFVKRIEGDPSNVIGLSLPLVQKLIRRTGLSISDLWATTID
ncbi:nucleoside triphosphate pyrophosphatase [Mycobacterium sp. pW049]|uniref:Maf family protein n=1 Tax=[Mycobacterium] bulgaricum TaxID=3238985 RepID=UPI00351AE95F